jgi:hypothetical protein
VTRVQATGLLYLAGVCFLLPAFFLSWYSISGSSSNIQATETFFPASVHVSSSSPSEFSSTYPGADVPNTGVVYAAATILLAGGLVLGTLVGVLVFTGLEGRYPKYALGLAVAAVILSLASPLFVQIDQPSAICSDARDFESPLGAPSARAGNDGSACASWEFDLGNGAWYSTGQPLGPGDSFAGHSSQYGSNLTWGPGPGWFLPLEGTGVLAAAAILHFVTRPTRGTVGTPS